ncbi:MAG: hypothetical protein HQ567_30655 [Candidatus Nealsonbacteria bacterium]|nr:hypothetical protein [Candidatus Nealsonbacteria bacterium]
MMRSSRSSERVVALVLAGLLAGFLSTPQGVSAQPVPNTVESMAAVQAEMAAMKAQLAQSRAEQDKLLAENADLQRQAAQLAEVRNEAAATNEATQKMIAALQQQAAALVKQLADSTARRDKNLKSVVELTDQLHQAFAEVKQLKDDNARLQKLIPAQAAAASLLEGVVKTAPSNGLVSISLGANHGLSKGHFVEIFRAGDGKRTAVGRIEVIETAPDSSLCQVDPKLGKDAIRQGDQVTFRKPDQPPAQPPSEPPYLFGGEVLSVAEDGQVEISFGSGDGLVPGHRLEVYRQNGTGGVYVGRIEVVQTRARQSTCKPVLEQGTIRKGDRITSKL